MSSRGSRTSRRWRPTPEGKKFAENCIELRNMGGGGEGGRGVGSRYATGMLLYIDRGSLLAQIRIRDELVLKHCLQVMSTFTLMSKSPPKFNDASAEMQMQLQRMRSKPIP